jgi:hypothetical protein
MVDANARKSAEAPPQQFEILSEEPSGHQMVHRVTAPDKAAAVEVVAALLDPGSKVVDSAPAGTGLNAAS